MKIIEVPKDVTVRFKTAQGEREELVTFKSWAENTVDFYSEGVKTFKQVRQVQKIVDALKAANGSLSLEDADYDLLKSAVEKYPEKIPPGICRQHLPFMDAIECAQDVKK